VFHGIATVRNSREVYFWVYTQKNLQQSLEEIFVQTMSIASLFTTAERWKQLKCPLMDA
jgi:hypothetical protein